MKPAQEALTDSEAALVRLRILHLATKTRGFHEADTEGQWQILRMVWQHAFNAAAARLAEAEMYLTNLRGETR